MSRLVQTAVIKDIKVDIPKILEVLKKFDLQFKVLILEDVTIEAQIFHRIVSMFQLDILVTSKVEVVDESENSEDCHNGEDVITIEKPINLLVLRHLDDSLLGSLIKCNVQSTKLALDLSYPSKLTAAMLKQ